MAAAAQFDPQDAVAPISIVEGPGVKVGESMVLRPIFGLETGVISNVFYEDTGATAAGLIRLIAQVGAGSLSKQRLEAPALLTPDDDGAATIIGKEGDVIYRADARLTYDVLLSGDRFVSGVGGLGAGVTLRALVNPKGTWSFGVNEDFRRLIRAANFETDANTNRDVNFLSLRVMAQPPGNNFSGLLHYDNTLDVFEKDTQHFANRMQHTFGVRAFYRWLPITRFFLGTTQGVFTGIGSSAKVDSYPLRIDGGVQTLLSLKTTFTLHGGYTAGLYSSGPSFSAPIFGAELGYRYSPMGRVAVKYDYAHQDSVNANYFRDHVVRAWVQHLFVPFVVTLQPELHLRQYQGVLMPDINGSLFRNDTILAFIGGIHYNYRNWMALTASYAFSTVQTDFRYVTDGLIDDPSYVRHEFLFGMRAAL
ncbi:MAG: hypothetical protein KF773_01755 [Deltaproteobacteria bacterium]|nr:hypothetical protein [Deltaproteobacteria bacterium]